MRTPPEGKLLFTQGQKREELEQGLLLSFHFYSLNDGLPQAKPFSLDVIYQLQKSPWQITRQLHYYKGFGAPF